MLWNKHVKIGQNLTISYEYHNMLYML